jgi:hypothetical protein
MGNIEGHRPHALPADASHITGLSEAAGFRGKNTMHFVWFWTFWHWSKESFRKGSLLRSPLHGIGSHWDEWFRHEASPNDLQAMVETGQTEANQRRFIAWLFRHWARGNDWPGNRMVPRFVLGQLAQVMPFQGWSALAAFRRGYGVPGPAALVLGEQSRGEPGDVREVEALALPADSAGPGILPEGFQAEPKQLEAPHQAARSLLRGQGLLVFLLLWILGGRRPYPRWVSVLLFAGWVTIAGLILYLWVGPEPGPRLFAISATLAGLWSGLMLLAAGFGARECFRAWRTGEKLSGQLERTQVRVRMNGGLTLQGGSAGLPFCLNTLLALHRAQPSIARGSWLWHRLFQAMRAQTTSWAGSGVITAGGSLRPVVIEPKLRACLQHTSIEHVITPRQRDASQSAANRLAQTMSKAAEPSATTPASWPGLQVGFAAERRHVQMHPCRHAAQSLLAMGSFISRWQIAGNLFALGVTVVMALALPDLRSILIPYPAPVAVPPSSTSPYHLWLSLDTQHPEYFSVVLESSYWSNRRAAVARHDGPTPSVRAEIQLHRLTGLTSANEEDGVVWVERRHRFFTREFHPGERVGRYSIPYLSRLGHE